MKTTIKNHELCMNCLKPGHFVRQCPSTHKCRKCQKPHHTLLHIDEKLPDPQGRGANSTEPLNSIVSHISQAVVKSHVLLMTCRVQVVAVDGSSTPARALLDSGSSTSFISERLARLPRTPHRAQIIGIGNLSHKSANQSVVRFKVSPIWPSERIFDVEAVVLPKVTCDLPVHPVRLDGNWKHLEGLQLADPDFGTPGRVDVLLGIDIFSSVLLQGRRHGGPNFPIALETCFGWVVTGNVQGNHPQRITLPSSLTMSFYKDFGSWKRTILSSI